MYGLFMAMTLVTGIAVDLNFCFCSLGIHYQFTTIPYKKVGCKSNYLKALSVLHLDLCFPQKRIASLCQESFFCGDSIATIQLRENEKQTHLTNLPRPDTVDSLSEWPLVDHAQLESVAPNLPQVVQEGTESSEGIGGGEECHVAKLDEHLQVVFKRPVVLE